MSNNTTVINSTMIKAINHIRKKGMLSDSKMTAAKNKRLRRFLAKYKAQQKKKFGSKQESAFPRFGNTVVSHTQKRIFANILSFVSPKEIAQNIALISRTWFKFSRTHSAHWRLVIISNERSQLAVSSSVQWLRKSRVCHFIKDLNIAIRMGARQMRMLAKVVLPALRELSVNIDDDSMTLTNYVVFLRNHPHLQWINGEFSTREQSRTAVVPLDIIPKLRCIGVERVYINAFENMSVYPRLSAIGHVRVFEEFLSSLSTLFRCCPNLKALSLSVDELDDELTVQLVKGTKLEILYLFGNLDEDDFGDYEPLVWMPLRKLKRLRNVMLVNFPRVWTPKVQNCLQIPVKTVENGLAFWSVAERYVFKDRK